MAKKYVRPTLWFCTASLLIFIFGRIFTPLSDEFLSEETQKGVLVKAIPFVATFVAILLLYILLIVLVAIRYNGRVPQRVYTPILSIIIAGIMVGVVSLFQPWELFSYKYGFVLLLLSTLAFILWSHVVPASARIDEGLPRLGRKEHVIGAAAGLIICAVIAGALAVQVRPEEPYGYRQRIWDRGLRDEEKARIAQQAEDDFRYFEVPFLIFMGLFPGGIVYFVSRELVAALSGETRPTSTLARPAEGQAVAS